MKRVISLLLLAVAAISVQAQGFDLYMANNLSDVQNMRRVTRQNSELKWNKITSNTIGGNQVEVQKVKEMFAKTSMKGLEEQKLFWKMRDNTALCFRINDGMGRDQVYDVQVIYNEAKSPLSLSVTGFFFLNLPHATDSVMVRVAKKGLKNATPADTVKFRYYAYDWDNDNLYTFRLDSKRQKTGLTYQIEYKLTEDGKDPITKTLDVKGDKFQSFYVPEDKTLSEIYLVNNDGGDQRKLKLDRSKLQYGVWLCQDFDKLKLESNVFMDKHEGRELTIFNMLGTGLMERYDILYLRVFTKNSDKGKEHVVKNATLHVERLNEKGEYVADNTVKVLGYDSHTQSYKIQTMTHPALVEVIASGYYPAIYQYAGAFDPVTKVLNPEKCTANMQLFPSKTDGKIIVSKKTLYCLKDTGKKAKRDNKEYIQCTIDSFDLFTAKETERNIIEDCGTTDKKLLNGQLIDSYVQMALTFSTAKSAGDLATPDFYAHEKQNENTKYTFSYLSRKATLAKDHPSLAYNYYQLRYNLTGKLPKGVLCKPTISTGSNVYKDFPYLKSVTYDKKKSEEKATKQAKDMVCLPTDKYISGSAGDLGLEFMTSPTFTWDLDNLPGLFFKLTPTVDFKRGIIALDVYVSAGAKADKFDGKASKENLKNNNVDHFLYNNKNGDNIYQGNLKTGSVKVDKEKWFMNEFDDIFKVERNKFGAGWFIEGNVGLMMPIDPFDVLLRNLEVGGGVAAQFFFSYDPAGWLAEKCKSPTMQNILNFTSKWLTLRASAILTGQAKAALGLRRYDFEKESWGAMNPGKMGWLAYVDLCLKAGVQVSMEIDATGHAEKPGKSKIINNLFQVAGKFRFGGKAQFLIGGGGQVGWQKDGEWSISDGGLKLLGMVGVDVLAELRCPFVHFRPRYNGVWGGQTWWPEHTANPFYPGYPWWKKPGAVRPKVPMRRSSVADIDTDNTYFDLGEKIAEPGGIPKPFFVSNAKVVVNREESEADPNGDAIVSVEAGATDDVQLSDKNLRATGLQADHAGEYSIVGYEQQTQTLSTAAGLTPDELVNKDRDAAYSRKIVAKMRQGNGAWKETIIANDNNYVDEMPFVAIQEDGRAAAIWKRGHYENSLYLEDLQIPAHDFVGKVVLSQYDGNKWSEPVPIMGINQSDAVNNMQIVMANDTILTAVHIITTDESTELKPVHTMWYNSKAWDKDVTDGDMEEIEPISFSMERVGDQAAIAILYENTDSLRDVYVKMVNMNGQLSGVGSTDMNLTQYMPESVKVVTDKTVDYPNDFCLLWTRRDNTVRRGTESIGFPQTQTILNASRIYVHDNLRPTPYVTVGASRDNLVMTGYDGLLDDLSITAVYGLSDPDNQKPAYVMEYTQEFINDFQYDISYTSKALLGSNTLPVNFRLYNTGTSPITSARFTVNNQPFELNDLYVGPYSNELFTVDYTIPDNFNGLLTVDNVSCDFDNVFNASHSPRRGASLHRVAKTTAKENVLKGCEDISCELLGHYVEGDTNIYEVELTDNSLNGMQKDYTVYVGIYPSPAYNIPVSDDAQQRITADDFIDVGGERKAYVTLYVDHVEESQPAFLNTFICDERILKVLSDDEDPGMSIIANLSGDDNLWMVQLIASEEDEITGMPLIQKDADHRKALVQREANGLRISGLTDGNRLRVFAADGKVVYSATVTSESQFVELRQRGVYLISTGDEIFKYNY